MTIHHFNLATAGSVGPSSHHSHSHVFRDLRHLTTFMQPSSQQSEPNVPTQSTAPKRVCDALARPSHDAMAHQGHDDSTNIKKPFQQPSCWDTESPKGTRDAGPSGLHQHLRVDEPRTPIHHGDPEMLKGSWDAGLSGSQRPRIDDSTQSCHQDPEMLNSSRDASLPGSRRPQIDEPMLSHHWDPETLKSSRDAGLSGLHQHPRIDESTTTESDTVLPQGTRDAGLSDTRHPRVDDHLELTHPTRIITVQDNSGIKRYLFDPNYARQLTLAMRLLSGTFNDYLQVAGLPRTFSFRRSSHYDMEFSELVYRQWATCLILKACKRRVLARIQIARETIRSFINKSELKPCLTSPVFSIDSMLSKEVQKMTTPDRVPSQGGSPLAEDRRWAQQIRQETDSAISSIIAASTQRLSQDTSLTKPARELPGSPTELPESQRKRKPTQDTTTGVAALEITKSQPAQPIPATQDLSDERNTISGASSSNRQLKSELFRSATPRQHLVMVQHSQDPPCNAVRSDRVPQNSSLNSQSLCPARLVGPTRPSPARDKTASSYLNPPPSLRPHELQQQRTEMEASSSQALTSSQVTPDTGIASSGYLGARYSATAAKDQHTPSNSARADSHQVTIASCSYHDGGSRMRRCIAEELHSQNAFLSTHLEYLAQQWDSANTPMSLRVANAASDRISVMRSSTPEPCSLGTGFHQEVNTAHSYKRGDSTRSSSSCSSSLLNGSTTLAPRVEESTRFHQRDPKMHECSREDNRSGSQCQQKVNLTPPSCRDLASLQDIQDTGASSYQLLQLDISDLVHARVTHIRAEDKSTLERPRKTQKQSSTAPYSAGNSISLTRPSISEPSSDLARPSSSCSPSLQNGPTTSVHQGEEPTRIRQRNVLMPRSSRDANLSGARGPPVQDITPPYSGDAAMLQSQQDAVAGSGRHNDAKPTTPIHSDAVPRKTPKLRLLNSLHQRAEALPPRPILQALPDPAITSSALLSNIRPPNGHSDSLISATMVEGQQDLLHAPLTSSRRVKKATHSHEHEEPAHPHQENTLIPGDSRENDRQGSPHPQAEDPTQSHYQDSEIPRTSDSRCRQIEDSVWPHYQDSDQMRFRVTRQPDNQHPAATNGVRGSATWERTGDGISPTRSNTSELSQPAERLNDFSPQNINLLGMQGPQTDDSTRLHYQDSALLQGRNDGPPSNRHARADLDDLADAAIDASDLRHPAVGNELGLEGLSHSRHGDRMLQDPTLAARSLCPARLPEFTQSNLVHDKMSSPYPNPQPSPANLAKGYRKTDGSSLSSKAKTQLAPPDASLATRASHSYKLSNSERRRLAHLPGPSHDRTTSARQEEELWLTGQLVTKVPEDSQDADRQTEDSTQSHYRDAAPPQGARKAGSPDSEHPRVKSNGIAYSGLTCAQPDDESLLKLHCNSSSYSLRRCCTKMSQDPKVENNMQHRQRQDETVMQQCFQESWCAPVIDASDSRQPAPENELSLDRANDPLCCSKTKRQAHSNQHKSAAMTSHNDVAARPQPDAVRYQDPPITRSVPDAIPSSPLPALSYNSATNVHSSSKVTSAQHSNDVQRHTASSIASATRLPIQESVTPFAAATSRFPHPSALNLYQAVKVSRSYKCGDSTRYNFLCSPSLLSGSTTLARQAEEPMRSLTKDIKTRKRYQKDDRLGSLRQRNYDLMPPHDRDFTLPPGTKYTSPPWRDILDGLTQSRPNESMLILPQDLLLSARQQQGRLLDHGASIKDHSSTLVDLKDHLAPELFLNPDDSVVRVTNPCKRGTPARRDSTGSPSLQDGKLRPALQERELWQHSTAENESKRLNNPPRNASIPRNTLPTTQLRNPARSNPDYSAAKASVNPPERDSMTTHRIHPAGISSDNTIRQRLAPSVGPADPLHAVNSFYSLECGYPAHLPAASQSIPSIRQEDGTTIHRIHPPGSSSSNTTTQLLPGAIDQCGAAGVCGLAHDSESSSPPPALSSKSPMDVYLWGSKASSLRCSKAGGDVQESSVSTTSQSARSAHYPTNLVAVSQSGPSALNGDRPATLTSAKGHPTESKAASSSPYTLNVTRLADLQEGKSMSALQDKESRMRESLSTMQNSLQRLLNTTIRQGLPDLQTCQATRLQNRRHWKPKGIAQDLRLLTVEDELPLESLSNLQRKTMHTIHSFGINHASSDNLAARLLPQAIDYPGVSGAFHLVHELELSLPLSVSGYKHDSHVHFCMASSLERLKAGHGAEVSRAASGASNKGILATLISTKGHVSWSSDALSNPGSTVRQTSELSFDSTELLDTRPTRPSPACNASILPASSPCGAVRKSKPAPDYKSTTDAHLRGSKTSGLLSSKTGDSAQDSIAAATSPSIHVPAGLVVVGGLDKQIEKLVEATLLPIKPADKFKTTGSKSPKGAFMYGPPGTGKTLLACACTPQIDTCYLKLAGPSLSQMFIGDGAKLVCDAFESAKEKAPAIIFIDELDAIGTKRFDSDKSGDCEVQRTAESAGWLRER